MYVCQCAGKFPMPFAKHKSRIIGLRATVNDTTAASQVRLWDDSGITPGEYGETKTTSETDLTTEIINIKGIASADANLEVLFPEPLALRYGTSIAVSNVVPGSLMLYIM